MTGRNVAGFFERRRNASKGNWGLSPTSAQAVIRLLHHENDNIAFANVVIFSVGYTQFGKPNCGVIRIPKGIRNVAEVDL